MMKKIFAILVVAAMVCMGSVASAADITMGGTIDIMSRMYQDLDQNADGAGNDEVRTLERLRVDMNAKAGDVKGKVTLENDFGSGVWGTLESNQGKTTVSTTVTPTTYTSTTKVSALGIREAWMLFPLSDTGVFVKAGHMNLALGQGQFFSSMRYGSDAWVAYKDIDTMHFGVVNVKASEGTSVSKGNDDVDAYVLVATNKMGEAVAGLDFSVVNMNRAAENQLMNLGLNYKGAVGPVALKAELDIQSGDASSTSKYAGYLVYVNGAIAMSPLTVNFTVASGSGDDGTDEGFTNLIDTNGHYTLIYEYMVKAASGSKNSGFMNTTALSAGAMYDVSKNLKVGADLWLLNASEKTTVNGGTAATDAGTEIDAKILWKLADNLNWNWTLGYFMPGGIYDYAGGKSADPTTGVQGMLTMTM